MGEPVGKLLGATVHHPGDLVLLQEAPVLRSVGVGHVEQVVDLLYLEERLHFIQLL